MMKIIKYISPLLSICTRKPHLIRRILRPQCGADSPQYGRSMIEMLGVLAIIGVLTIGSITAYSKAMQRHLLNRQREQISYILSAVETHYDELKISSMALSTGHITSIFKTLGWIPEDMIKDNSNNIYDIFKNEEYIGFWNKTIYLHISITQNNSFEQCINLYQSIKPFHPSLYLTEVYEGTSYNNYYFGDRYCTGNNCLRNLTLAQISQLCTVCKDRNQCSFFIYWK